MLYEPVISKQVARTALRATVEASAVIAPACLFFKNGTSVAWVQVRAGCKEWTPLRDRSRGVELEVHTHGSVRTKDIVNSFLYFIV